MTDTERREKLTKILQDFISDDLDCAEAIEAIEELFSLKPFRRPTPNLAPPELQDAFKEGAQRESKPVTLSEVEPPEWDSGG